MVRLVVRDLPLSDIHPSAVASAVASRCAAAQGQYWPMYERLFLTHGEEWGGVPKRDREVFVAFAAELGLDAGAFSACQDDPATEQEVLAESAAVQRLGINVTPTFIVNGQQLRGGQPFRVFEALIRREAGR